MPNFVFPGGYFVFCPETDTVETWLACKDKDGTRFELAHTTTSAIFMQWKREYERCFDQILAHREGAEVIPFKRADG